MLTAEEFAQNLVNIMQYFRKQGHALFGDGRYYDINSVGVNGNKVRVICSDHIGGSDTWELQLTTSGAAMVTPEPEMPPVEAVEPTTDVVSETQGQGVKERVDRQTRIEDPAPDTNNTGEKTPHRPANNDPTKTSRGKAAVKRQIKRNKKHPEKFAEEVLSLDWDALQPCELVDLAECLEEPIAESLQIRAMIKEAKPEDAAKLARVDEVIGNVWHDRLTEHYVGVCLPGHDTELVDPAAKALLEAKEWGARLAWIERVLVDGAVVYKVCTDTVPSEIYIERREMTDRNLILSEDRANIIRIIHGEK